MENRKDIDKEIEATLNSLDGAGRAEVSAFFYTRVEARLQNQKTVAADSFIQRLISRPAFAVSVLTVFLVLNIVAIKGISQVGSATNQKPASDLQNFATEYNMNTTSLYNNSDR